MSKIYVSLTKVNDHGIEEVVEDLEIFDREEDAREFASGVSPQTGYNVVLNELF